MESATVHEPVGISQKWEPFAASKRQHMTCISTQFQTALASEGKTHMQAEATKTQLQQRPSSNAQTKHQIMRPNAGLVAVKQTSQAIGAFSPCGKQSHAKRERSPL